jgi:hypothetical protein
MASFTKQDVADLAPFGIREYLRSTEGLRFEHYTLAASTVRTQTINGVGGQKIAQRGLVLAKITTGAEAGKVGPFVAGATDVVDGRQTVANIVGILETFLPWQLMDRDVEVAVAYTAAVIQAWCLEYNGNLAATTEVALSNTTAAAMIGGGAAGKGVSILFK